MKPIPLFDDWLLNSHQEIVRRFGQPRLCRQKIDCEDGDASVFPGGYINVIRDPESGMYKYWYPASGGNGHSLLCYLESEDGFT
tara:strand:+ start:435 stop:686 length:252 start_codon:yes stop_codon:yes gene_type:complete